MKRKMCAALAAVTLALAGCSGGSSYAGGTDSAPSSPAPDNDNDTTNEGTDEDDGDEVTSPACIIGGARLESFTAADLSREEFGDTYTIQLTGEWTDDDLKSLGEELKKITGKHITLDMARATGITSIEDNTFSFCPSLTSITIPDGVTSIGDWAFHDCPSLANVTIPDSVTSIGDYAFFDCPSLASVTIGDGVTSIGNAAFNYCESLTSITIPGSVTSIGGNAFEGCSSLASVTIPGSVTSIGYAAFWGCGNLTSIIIPDSVTSIRGAAFYGCGNLNDVYYGGTQEQWESIGGNNTSMPSSATIHYNSSGA